MADVSRKMWPQYSYTNGSSSYMYHHQPFYCSHPQMNPITTGLTQVFATYAPGATVLYIDSKEKKTLRLSLATKRIIAALICLVLVGGIASLYMGGPLARECYESDSGKPDANLPIPELPQLGTSKQHQERQEKQSVPVKPLPLRIRTKGQNPERTRIAQERLPLPLERQNLQRNPEPRVIFSFDDNDNDNEARVETVW